MAKERDNIPVRRFPQFVQEKGWNYVNANELFEPIVNKNHNSDLPVLAITQDQGAVPREKIGYNVIVSEKSIASYKVVEVGDFIISLRSFQGGIEYSYYKGLCSPAYIVLRKKNDTICNDFYRHYFKSWQFIQDLNRNLEGIRDGKMVSYQQFSAILIPYPPFAEQQRIADCLSTIDSYISSINEKVEQLKAHKKSLLQKLFPQEGNIIPKCRFPEFQENSAWEKREFKEVIKVNSGRDYKHLSSGNIPVYGTGGYMLSVDGKLSDQDAVGIGRKGTIDRPQYLKAPFWTVDTLFFLTNCDGYDIEFIYYLSQIIQWKKYGEQTGVPSLSKISIENLEVIVPTNIAEQKRIAETFSSLDKKIELLKKKSTLLEEHKKGLMQQLFPKA